MQTDLWHITLFFLYNDKNIKVKKKRTKPELWYATPYGIDTLKYSSIFPETARNLCNNNCFSFFCNSIINNGVKKRREQKIPCVLKIQVATVLLEIVPQFAYANQSKNEIR